ncbi:hypothetical protein [Erythrobacter colymbi]|jgi:hypothetical protein|uniref:hypothetical protein n=1 Tax=Erythrobacter colymbi TaxID=1161202 RepID=UPI0012DC6FBA|nr:hypothetical protein [Erythrobacter colymbi]
MIADPAEHRYRPFLRSGLRPSGAMAPVDAMFSAPFQHLMLGNDDPAVDDAHEVRQLLDLSLAE